MPLCTWKGRGKIAADRCSENENAILLLETNCGTVEQGLDLLDSFSETFKKKSTMFSQLLLVFRGFWFPEIKVEITSPSNMQ